MQNCVTIDKRVGQQSVNGCCPFLQSKEVRMKIRKLFSLLLMLTMIMSTAPLCVYAAAESAGETGIQEEVMAGDSNGEENPAYVRTIMMYLCGSNLETYSAMATYNIRQILESKFSGGDKVKFIIMTGGSDEWHTPSEWLVDAEHPDQTISIDPEYNQVWEAKGADAAENPGKMVLLEKEGLQGKKARVKTDEGYDEDYKGELMSHPELLKDFINYCAENYPAEKYDLILWDHGSGPLGGFANDEGAFFAEMYFGEILDAFSDNAVTKDGGKFDFVNFDACLMGSVEFALAFADCMDYYIASPETIPGYGEYYTGWLDELGKDPYYDTYDLGRKIVDDYIEFYEDESAERTSGEGTLAVINMDKLVNYYGLAETLKNLPFYLKQQATEQDPELNDFLFYDEFDSGKNSLRYGGEKYYDLGTLVSELSFDFKELTKGDVLDSGEIIDENIYTEPLANISHMLAQKDMIYARGTKGIKSRPLYYRDTYGKTDYGSVGTSGLYLFFPAADGAREVNGYFGALAPVVSKLDEDIKALESEASGLDPESPEAFALDIKIRNLRSRLEFLDSYRHALIDYALISKVGYSVSMMLDEGYDRSSINYDSLREYFTGGATYDPSIEDLEAEENMDYTISDWNMEFMPFLLNRADMDPDGPFSTHAEAEKASRDWLNEVITQQAEENISRNNMTLEKTEDDGYGLRMQNTQKRVVEDVRYNITAHIPAADKFLTMGQESGEFGLMSDEEKEDFITAKIGHVSGIPVLKKEDGTVVDQDSKRDYLDWYMEPGGTWELPPIDSSWYTVSDANGYCHVANIETDEDAGEIYFYGNYKSENGIDTLCALSFDENGDLQEILLGAEDGNSYRRIPASEMVGTVEVMPIRQVTIFVDEVSIPLSLKPIIVSPDTVSKIKLVKKDLNDIEDLKQDSGNVDVERKVVVRDIYGYEVPFETSVSKARISGIKTSYKYTGKVKKPVPVVELNDKKLVKDTDYTVKYSSNKNVGKAKVVITGKGDYTGTVTKTFKILPKGTSVKSLKKAKKAIVVSWKKQSAKMSKSRITGYQIQVATNPKFTRGKKTVSVKGYGKVSKKISKLKGKKKYYVRIRTYKVVKGTKYYSAWSKAKTVTTGK